MTSRKGPVTRRRRSSRRVNFIPPLTGSRAPWERVLEAAGVRERVAEAASEARVTYRAVTDADEEPVLHHGPAMKVNDVAVASLAPVRRPTAYRGMPNYIGRLAVPNAGGPTAVWVESLHELTQLKDQWLTEPTRSVMTQPFRLEFVWPEGVRSRVPDFLAELKTGERLLVDVTRSSVLGKPQRAATFALTAAWARSVGMRYELRTEMPPKESET